MTKILIAIAGDVIFVPATQTTHHSMERAIKSNLKRRIPDFDVSVGSVVPDDDHMLVRIVLRGEVFVDGTRVAVTAVCNASPADLRVVEVQFTTDAGVRAMRPAQIPRSPESVAEFVSRLAKVFAPGV